MNNHTIERRHGRDFLLRHPHAGEPCGDAHDGYRCILEPGHGGEEHIATGFWDRSGSEIFARWPVVEPAPADESACVGAEEGGGA